MFRNVAIMGSALALLAFGTSAKSAFAQSDPYTINYFLHAHTAGPDDTLRILDPDDQDSFPACANIYVFDASQELQECCACFITAAGRADFSVNALTSNPVNPSAETGGVLSTGVIKIVKTNVNLTSSSAPGYLPCDPTNGATGVGDSGLIPSPPNDVFATAGSGNPDQPNAPLFSWTTHDENQFSTGGTAVSEEVFQSTGEPLSTVFPDPTGPTSGGDLGILQHKCAVTISRGSAHHSGTCQALCPPPQVD